MSAKIIPLYQQQLYSGSYEFTTTSELDLDYRKYLARQLRDVLPPTTDEALPTEATPIDISLDDIEGDVVAGISAWTARDVVTVDLLWVGEPIRGQGIGRRLLQMVEEEALRRGCQRARVCVTTNVAFFVGAGFTITGTVQALSFRAGQTPAQSIYWLEKAF